MKQLIALLLFAVPASGQTMLFIGRPVVVQHAPLPVQPQPVIRTSYPTYVNPVVRNVPLYKYSPIHQYTTPRQSYPVQQIIQGFGVQCIGNT